jgi:hypothetical protein
MRRSTTRTTDVLDREVDFERFGPARRNAFAGAGERGGPSLLALARRLPIVSGPAAPARTIAATKGPMAIGNDQDIADLVRLRPPEIQRRAGSDEVTY